MGDPVEVRQSFTILRPPEELYRFWRELSNLPRFMKHVESVVVTDDRRSHWTVSGPAGTSVEWDAEIIEDEPGRALAWRSLPGASVENHGAVTFLPATGARGTVVTVALAYDAPAGGLGAGIAKLFGEEPEIQAREDLRRFKQLAESGEIPTTDGQPSGREDAEEKKEEQREKSALPRVSPDRGARREREVTS